MKLFIDTQIWRYLTDRNEVTGLESYIRANNISIVITPSLALEILRTEDKSLRDKLLRNLINGRRERLLPEAYFEAQEYLSIFRKYRPQYLRKTPKQVENVRVRRKWLRTIWKQMKDDSDLSLNQHENSLSEPLMSEMDHVHSLNKKNIENGSLKLKRDFNKEAEFGVLLRVNGESRHHRFVTTPAKIENLNTLQLYLDSGSGLSNSTRMSLVEWLEPFVHIDRIDVNGLDFANIFLNESRETELPRSFARHTISYFMSCYRVKRSDLFDAQHSSHLLDVDYFITADKNFYSAIVDAKGALGSFSAIPILVHNSEESIVEQIDSELKKSTG